MLPPLRLKPLSPAASARSELSIVLYRTLCARRSRVSASNLSIRSDIELAQRSRFNACDSE